MIEPQSASAPSPARPGVTPRRGFLNRAVGLGAGALAMAAAPRGAPAQSPPVDDPAMLNFALNLEYLEAEYYTFAVTGSSIEAQGISTTGLDTGGGNPGPIAIKANPRVPFQSEAIRQYAAEIAVDEQRHVSYLRGVLSSLGATPAARPAIDLQSSFNALAAAAGLPTPFDPFADDVSFLLGAYIFEDVGVSAYRGGSPLIQSKAVLSGAAGILGTESYHSGIIRTILFQLGQGATTQAISNLRRTLGGSVDYGVAAGPLGQGPAGTASVPLGDANATSSSRTARQVLNIVYGSVNAPAGLFFPLGLNGPIR